MKQFFCFSAYLLCSLFIFWNVTTVFADSNLENGTSIGEVSEGEVFTQNDITYRILKINDGKGELQVGDGEHTLNNSEKNIVIPSVVEYKNHLFNVTEIGSLAFAVFESEDGHASSGIYAEKVTIPNTVKKIQKQAFFGSNVLKEIEFEEQSRLNIIDDQAFYFSTISKIDFPTSLEYIGTRAFSFTHLISISFPINSKLQIISHEAFAHNDSLESVVLSDNLEQMGEKVFGKSKNLKSIKVSDKNSYFSSEDGVLFDKKKERLILYPPKKETSSYKTPETVKVIEEAAFALNENYLKELELNEGLVEIKPFAFQRNLELKKVKLPNSVSKIGRLAFYDNWKLEDIKIPSSIEELSTYTLYNVPKLKSIEFGENIKILPENFIGGILEELQIVKIASRDHFKVMPNSFPVDRIGSIVFMVPNENIAQELIEVGIDRKKITIDSGTPGSIAIDDIVENPGENIPAGYHKVTFTAGEGTSIESGTTVFAVKDGVSLPEDKLPVLKAKDGYTDAKWPKEATQPITADDTEFVSSATKLDDKSDADKYNPEGQKVTTELNKEPDASEAIKNKKDLPKDTKYTWKEKVDVNTAGNKKGTVVVTYPDGSSDEVEVDVTVTDNRSDADKYTPMVEGEKVEIGGTVDLTDNVTNLPALPEGTTVTDVTPGGTIDTNTPGNYEGVIEVTYPDGTKDTVKVPVEVTDNRSDADKYNPESQKVTTDLNKEPDASGAIKNKKDLPKDTKYTWKEKVEVSTAGNKKGTVVVTYPDGSSDEVEVDVTVTDTRSDADKYNPEGQKVTTDLNKEPDASEAIKNKKDLPKGTTYTWKEKVEVNTAGNKKGTVVVTYPDGSKEEVEITISVVDKKAPNKPQVDPITEGDQIVTGKTEPNAEVTVTLPDGSQYHGTADKNGNFTVNVPKLEAGTKVRVTATDESGNTSEPTNVVVSSNKKDSGKNGSKGSKTDNQDGNSNQDKNRGKSQSSKVFPKTGESDSNIFTISGGFILLGTLGLLGYKNRKKRE